METAIKPSLPKGTHGAYIRPSRVPVDDDAKLSALIGDIYDTTLDPAIWPNLLKQIGDFTGGTAICFHYQDGASGHNRHWLACGRSDPDYDRLYLDEYFRIDPAVAAVHSGEVGRLVGVGDVMDPAEYRASAFYREWAYPQQLVDRMGLWLDKSPRTSALIVVHRFERNGLDDTEMRRRVLLIAPHLRRAALVGRSLEHKTAEAAALADTFDGLRAALLLVDAEGRVVHANVAGTTMLRKCDVLRTVSGKVAATEPAATPALLRAFAAAKGGDRALEGRGLSIALPTREGEHYVAHVLPLTSAERRGAQGRRGAVAALLVQKTTLELGSLAAAVAEAFDLTPAELRVLLAIVENGSVSEAAAALGIGQATVKTHLHRVFGKTDTRRQADLVRLVAGFACPLAD